MNMLPKLPITIDPLSLCSLFINFRHTRKDDNKASHILASGAGFLFKDKNRYFLITNWHNVTGFNPNTGKRLDSQTATSPDSIGVHIKYEVNSDVPNTRLATSKEIVLPIYDTQKRPLWYIHPQHGKKVDVVAIPIIATGPGANLKTINQIEFDDVEAEVGDDVFILGFPHGYQSKGSLPIWKRGSLASEPQADFDGLPKVIVDTASRPGMSGAPVIYRRSGIHGLKDGKMIGSSSIGTMQGFCGIYSGRLAGSEETSNRLDTQLGIVWKEQVIKEVIEGQSKDTGGHYPDLSQKDVQGSP